MDKDFSDYGNNLSLTEKAIEALRVISNAENNGMPIDLDTVLSRLAFHPTKQAFQFTLRALIKRGLVEKVGTAVIRGKRRRLLKITMLGLHKMHSDSIRNISYADKKTCNEDETLKTDLLLKEIEDKFEEDLI
jgi:hypothetical protein